MTRGVIRVVTLGPTEPTSDAFAHDVNASKESIKLTQGPLHQLLHLTLSFSVILS